jgi:hypothetical protein
MPGGELLVEVDAGGALRMTGPVEVVGSFTVAEAWRASHAPEPRHEVC